MSSLNIIDQIAPCGLDCSRCATYKDGEIPRLASRLTELLKGYSRVAKMRENTAKEFQGYAQFEDVLNALTTGNCGGCRSEAVQCPIECKPKECTKEKKVDFCFQCPEYVACTGPSCTRWRKLNDRLKEIGVPAFYKEQLRTPRYSKIL
ncbi:MAG: hypothetical protein RBG13Loki_0007 [Promethearchaeota archaeon CR_4]|nr:MAG: hypothetical protein RBG13Loki_0007 [Candidatus Lokiarchaeota archaeon CR_4]